MEADIHIQARQQDWIDQLYEAASRKNKRERWMDRDYTNLGSRLFIAYRMANDPIQAIMDGRVQEALRNKADAKRMSILQMDWIGEAKERSPASDTQDKIYGEQNRPGLEAVILSYIVRSTAKRSAVVEQAEEYLSASGEEVLAQELGLWRLNCKAVDADQHLYAMYAMITSPAEVYNDAFEKRMLQMRAGEYLREGKDPLHIVKMLHGKPLSPYDGWQEDHADTDRLLEAYQPVTIERANVVARADDVLKRLGAPFAPEFSVLASKIAFLQRAKDPPGTSPNPALP